MVSVVRPSRGGGAGFCSGLTIIKLCWAAAAILLVAMHRHFLSSSSTGETYYSDADDASASSNAESAYSDASESGNEMSAYKAKNRKFHEKKEDAARKCRAGALWHSASIRRARLHHHQQKKLPQTTITIVIGAAR